MARSLQFSQHLQTVADFFTKYGDEPWAQTFSKYAALAREGHDVRGRVHGLWGGMGSLTDLIICSENGHRVSKEGAESANREMAAVLEPVWYAVHRVPKQ